MFLINTKLGTDDDCGGLPETYHTFNMPGTSGSCDSKSMPRFFGSDPAQSNSFDATTAYLGVDVNSKGTIIAAGVTHNYRQLTDETGKEKVLKPDWWSNGMSFTPILHFYPKTDANAAKFFTFIFGQSERFIDIAVLHDDNPA